MAPLAFGVIVAWAFYAQGFNHETRIFGTHSLSASFRCATNELTRALSLQMTNCWQRSARLRLKRRICSLPAARCRKLPELPGMTSPQDAQNGKYIRASLLEKQ